MLQHNAAVKVLSGEYQGEEGSIVSLERIGTDPVYLVELASGEEALISQSSLRLHAV